MSVARRILTAIAGVLVTLLLGLGAWHGYRAVVAQPVKRVVMAGQVDRLPHAELEALAVAIQSAASPNLDAIRESARRVSWVREATVRRQFPDAVVITFEAHDALARWDEGRMVSTSGDVFAARDAGKLPRFRGPEGSAPIMAREYPAIARALAPLGDPVQELRLSRRGAWQAVLESGLTLQLGRGNAVARLQRFVAAWPKLKSSPPDYVDLRYANGFAVRRAAVLKVKP